MALNDRRQGLLVAVKVNVQLAEAQVGRLLHAALVDEEVAIFTAGKPVAGLSPIVAPARNRGAAAGKARLTDAFFEPLPEFDANQEQECN